jgi:AraC-like DNA-binding protein
VKTFVRAAALTNYFEVAEQVGLDPEPVLKATGLSRAVLADPETRIEAGKVIRLLEQSARASGSLTFGLRMAESRQLADFGAVSLLLKHQRTLRDALVALIDYRHLVNDAVAIRIEDAGTMVILRQEIVADYSGPRRQAMELALGVLSRLSGSLLGGNWRPYSINFTHEAPPDLRVHRRVFKGRVEFTSDFNGIVCAAADLERPNPLADPALARYAMNLVEALPGAHDRSIVLDVRKTIHMLLPAGRISIERVAQQLGINVRTLQRQLESRDAVFSDLVTEVRRDLVLRYLDTPGYSLSRIAELLGYATPGSFTRWFTAQFGVAPAAWRQRQRHDGSALHGS